MNPTPARLRRILFRALHAAGDVHRRCARRGFSVTHKGPVDIVTDADRAAEDKIVRVVRRECPDHGFLMEESGARPSASPYRWIIDPLDGTINFAHGLPIFCVSIGLEKNGRVIMGGVYAPLLDELFFAEKGRGAFLNDRKIHVSRKDRLINSLVVTGFPYDRYKKARFYLSFVERFMKRTQGLRRLGAAALDLCYVAAGRFDAYWEFNIKPWDAAAGALLVGEAGGRVSDFRGGAYGLADTRQTLASNGRVHKAMLSVLRPGAGGFDKMRKII